MDKIKTILILIAIILGTLTIFATIGFLYSLVQFLFLAGVIGLAGYIAIRLLSNKRPRELDSSGPERHLQKVERTLEEYRRKLK
ncbi:MAG TPA: hypothetical protein VJ751_10345 [Pyrinomonadaceae bacterium]|jgi:uncharacterized membrane-anchored protein YhcB (DUF1043 family)|nr:hypothetical protein [Pyrinomonadaceae bacterium]